MAIGEGEVALGPGMAIHCCTESFELDLLVDSGGAVQLHGVDSLPVKLHLVHTVSTELNIEVDGRNIDTGAVNSFAAAEVHGEVAEILLVG